MTAETHSTTETRAMAFDPAARPELYDGVRTRRIFAFLVDAGIIFLLMVLASVVVAVLGLFTFGLGWLLFPLIWPFVAILYTMFTLGGPHSATPGMRLNGVEMRTWYGAPMYPVLALVHAIGFWLSVTILTPLVLLVALVTPRKRLLHDILLGTIVIRRL
ncbi:MAG TPA: RDD family protein [Afifellaceae bacterium]|nr:RDD family protein [Afifellaceae bacterium]